MKHFFFLVLFFLAVFQTVSAKSEADSAIQVLFSVLNNKALYMIEKEQRIGELNKMLQIQDLTDKQCYSVYRQLYEEYYTYNIDSAVYYLETNLVIAEKLHDTICMYETKLDLAVSYWLSGKYLESLTMMESLDRSQFDRLPESFLLDYYEAYKRIYLYYSASGPGGYYAQQGNLYRDSMLLLVPHESQAYQTWLAEKLADENRTDEAKQIIEHLIAVSEDEDREMAILMHLLANIYRKEGNVEMQKKYYALSAVCDIKSAVKENASMMSLALLLYEEDDIDKAYQCIQSSLDDAVFCNARFRTFEITELFPIIDSAYHEKAARQRAQLQRFLLLTTLFSLFLIAATVYVYRQMKRIARIRKELYHTNVKLNELNHTLNESNVKLKELNQELSSVNCKLAETNRVKEAYLGKFIDLCSNYIEKMDNYRRNLNKIASKGKMDELFQSLKSSRFIDIEWSDFYTNFDETFLRIYPSFIQDFNALFPEELRQTPRTGELLNSELRIYALIRLGINDSAKISIFLRYSITTIYTYRSKLKNKSLFPSNLEEQVMKIN